MYLLQELVQHQSYEKLWHSGEIWDSSFLKKICVVIYTIASLQIKLEMNWAFNNSDYS